MDALDYAIVFVSDMDRSVKFYRDTLDLPLKFESAHWTEFATKGATLALHPATEAFPAGTCRPGFHVTNLAEVHQSLLSQGVRCVQEPREEFGVQMARYADRDGQEFTIAEVRG